MLTRRFVTLSLALLAQGSIARAESVDGSASSALPAGPTRLSLKVDPAVGFAVTGPQRDAFGTGGGALIKGAYGPRDWIDLQLTAGGLTFSPEMEGSSPGLFAGGGGVRLQFPQERNRVSPFVDGDALYVRTGGFNRFGFSAAAGVLFAVDRPRTYWVGLHVRYLQVMQPSRDGYDTTDAQLLLFGLSTQFGVGRKPERPRPVVVAAIDSDGDGLVDKEDKCPLVVGPSDNGGCPYPDGDKDGVLDKVDRCPSEAGPTQNEGCPWPDSDGDSLVDIDDKCPKVPGLRQFGGCPDADNDGVPEPPDLCPATPGAADNDGCPRYKQIVVTTKTIELSQKIFFAYDKATILPKSDGLLADVVQAFKDYPGLQVRIEGHTDSRGRLAHNMKLSQARADAVKRYLVEHGVAADRITSAIGYGPNQPLDTNKTAEGRERNRRVEFVVEGRGEEAPGK